MMLQRLFILSLIVAASCALVRPTSADSSPRPNILWITAEDMSATLGCYGDRYAKTPNIDRLAEESVRYTHAFATAPVCSPARSTLITGCYAPSLGTHHMRSAFPLPTAMRGFPAHLRERGYHTSNRVKTDYNTANEPDLIKASWDSNSETAHWRDRSARDQPFFSVFNSMTSHQSRTMVWPYEQFVEEVQSRLSPEEIHDPADAPLPPYYPDTPVVRRSVARYYDCVTAMDREVGALLDQLEADGLADDTIVFFFSDHGSGMPRHKRVLLDSGMHVPLLIRFPERYRHLAPAGPGETTDRLVSFVDFAATVLSLAGAEIPEYMQGQPFLGEHEALPRQRVYGHRDRVDEALDVARSVRDGRFLYLRNYLPHRGYNQPSAWPDQGELNHEFYRLADPGNMSEAQWHFAAPSRPVEELYDCESDPFNVYNLVDSPEHQNVLAQMREAHRRHLRKIHDLGFLAESEAWRVVREGTTLWEAARRDTLGLEALYDAAAQVGVADEAPLLANLASPDANIRYWGAIGLAARSGVSAEAERQLEASLKDDSLAVRIEVAGALARHGHSRPAMAALIDALEHPEWTVVLHTARVIEMLGERARDAAPAMRQARARAERWRSRDASPAREQDLAWFVEFATTGFLSRVDGDPHAL